MANAKRDENNVPTLLGVSSVDGVTPVVVYADPTSHRLLVTTSLPLEAPFGTINGSNTAFSVSGPPAVVFSDKGVFTDGHGYTYSPNQINFTAPNAPAGFVLCMMGNVQSILAP